MKFINHHITQFLLLCDCYEYNTSNKNKLKLCHSSKTQRYSRYNQFYWRHHTNFGISFVVQKWVSVIRSSWNFAHSFGSHCQTKCLRDRILFWVSYSGRSKIFAKFWFGQLKWYWYLTKILWSDRLKMLHQSWRNNVRSLHISAITVQCCVISMNELWVQTFILWYRKVRF